MNFSYLKPSRLKPIALYYPENNYININNHLFCGINYNEIDTKRKIIFNQIKLAKNHGIYGFAINYIFLNSKWNIYDEIVNIFLSNKQFHFLLNWENSNLIDSINELNNITKNTYKLLKIQLERFVKRIKKYLTSNIYIKINKKPVISIENPIFFKNPSKALLTLRKKIKENGIKEIFIISPLNTILNHSNYGISYYKFLLDAVYDSSNINFFENGKDRQEILYYSGLIYKNIELSKINETMLIFRSSIISVENNYSNNNSIKDYTPEKFYILNNIIINWTIKNYKKTKGIFFINSWNNYQKGSYLEQDNILGYSTINSFSKALFNLSFNDSYYNFKYLYNRCIIAVQAHVFYKDLLFEIINKTNNIPLKFDLFISTLPEGHLDKFEKNIRIYSKASKYEIFYSNNKGRDVLPFIMQMKNKIKKYKYICHIHTKKTNHNLVSGDGWRNYLYENLLGDSKKITQILYDFENIKDLGFIFPEPYYDVIKHYTNFEEINFSYHEPNIKYMNIILHKIFKRTQVGNKLTFPVGDMFWAKTKSIHQIFNFRFDNLFPKELGQINETIMHAIERIWLYLVKKNGYYYKIIFNHY